MTLYLAMFLFVHLDHKNLTHIIWISLALTIRPILTNQMQNKTDEYGELLLDFSIYIFVYILTLVCLCSVCPPFSEKSTIPLVRPGWRQFPRLLLNFSCLFGKIDWISNIPYLHQT